MTVHREQSMKREDQQDATVRCLLLTSVSTCLGHHYAHLQENKGRVTATTQRPTTATNHIQQNQRSTPYAVTPVFVLLMMGIMMSETC